MRRIRYDDDAPVDDGAPDDDDDDGAGLGPN